MNGREKRLIYALAGFLVVGAAVAAYMLVWSPIQDAKADADRIQDEIDKKQGIYNKMMADAPRAAAAKKRSLPANRDDARVEYSAMLYKLLRGAGVPAGFTVSLRDSLESKSIPVLDAKSKKPAYEKIGYEIRMKKVDLGMLTAFLQAYYKLNLLQQITRFEVVRKDSDAAPGGAKTQTRDRADLEVVLQTEAIILDGAEARKTLLPVSIGAAALVGNIGYQTILNAPEVGRGITPMQISTVLASAGAPRDYSVLPAKNVFHGPLPPPAAPVAPPRPVEVAVVVEKPKEDISGYIKLTGVSRHPDGKVIAAIRDLANNNDYQIELTPKAGKYDVKVEKFYQFQGKPRRFYKAEELVIAEEDSSTNRTFKIVGVDGFGLVVSEDGAGPDPAAKPEPKERGSARGGKTVLAPPPPVAAVAGVLGVVAASPAGERVFVWQAGETLKMLSALPKEKAADALKRAVQPPPPEAGRVAAGTAE